MLIKRHAKDAALNVSITMKTIGVIMTKPNFFTTQLIKPVEKHAQTDTSRTGRTVRNAVETVIVVLEMTLNLVLPAKKVFH